MLHPAGPIFAPLPARPRRTFAFVMARYSSLRRLVSLLLAVLVLTASVGLTVQRLTCRMSGRSTVSVAVAGQAIPRGCLAPPATARLRVAKANGHCCDVSKHLHKLSNPAQELAAKVLLPLPELVAGVPEAGWRGAATAQLPLATASPRWFAADSSPPPRGGRELLVFVGTLVV